jgi:hypothetical protein
MLVLWLVAAHTSPGISAPPADMVLTVDAGVLSLRAQNASIREIFEAIGQQLSMEVVACIPADERITIAFDLLPFTDALKRFRPYVSYMALGDTMKAPGTIRKLIMVSKRVAGLPARPTTRDGGALAPPAPSQSEAPTPAVPVRPKPFTFEFDPTAVGECGR